MSDAALLLLVESRKKSGWLAALLNLFLPGAGYIYCGRWILGIFAFFFIVALVLVSFGLGHRQTENFPRARRASRAFVHRSKLASHRPLNQWRGKLFQKNRDKLSTF